MRQLPGIAWRNFVRNLQRYRLLFVALTLLVAVMVLLLGGVVGIRDSLRSKASRYFAGDMVVLGFEDSPHPRIDEPEKILEMVNNLNADLITHSVRSMYYEQDAALFHAGNYARQRRLVGVEWDLERPILGNFDFVSGGLPDSNDEEGIVISDTAARSLSANAGDRVLVRGNTEAGQANTVQLEVRGIFRESSFFGYSAYMHRTTLNRLRQVQEDNVQEIGVYLRNPERDADRVAAALTDALSQEFPTFPVVGSRSERNSVRDEIRARNDERESPVRHYGVTTLNAQLAEIHDLLEALTAVATALVAFFLLIVGLGVSNTYTLLVFERTREIGTMRALGMQRWSTVALLAIEAVYLGIVAILAGLLLGVVALEALRLGFDFSGQVWASLFLVGGRLQWSLPVGWILGISLLTLGASLAGCVRSAHRAGRIRPVDAMSHK